MKQLTDLEMCKFITILILKEKFSDAKSIEFDENQNCFWVDSVGFTSWPLLNPLTDDALCFQLMVKHKITFESCPFYVGRFIANGNDENGNKILPKISNESPNKAILLAIIEAQNEN